ncbi:TetR/AcrR family transcriptional regulator [Pollutimonas thiosulfatoxidans]|uniref:TetR family transcriptional regulator n=1 Tax=Pollutimonas thiosulfatoxidans TaxID=2028345 RepID=A0A410G8S6_9BURK|nr:TetR/AcrR family transcriptional regulator [Pollutimonas thiosulfatoxidans]QAA92712.1 TetR family transcriptional regulator [Pollutimonas thiosulfatoxidans]
MIADFESFKVDLSLSKLEICRELYTQNRQLIRIKNEQVAVRNLVRIIDSTLRLAATRGFHAMSLRDLCADTGFSIGGLYAYIRSKDDLLYLIQSHGFLLTRRTMLAYTEGIADSRDKLLAAVKAHVYLSELMQPWFYFSFMETKALPDKHKKEAIAIELEVENMLCAIIEAGMGAGVFRRINARLLASLCKAMMQDWYLKRRKYSNQCVSATEYAEFIGQVLDCYLSADLPASHYRATLSG